MLGMDLADDPEARAAEPDLSSALGQQFLSQLREIHPRA
jgi:hypothetical protein